MLWVKFGWILSSGPREVNNAGVAGFPRRYSIQSAHNIYIVIENITDGYLYKSAMVAFLHPKCIYSTLKGPRHDLRSNFFFYIYNGLLVHFEYCSWSKFEC